MTIVSQTFVIDGPSYIGLTSVEIVHLTGKFGFMPLKKSTNFPCHKITFEDSTKTPDDPTYLAYEDSINKITHYFEFGRFPNNYSEEKCFEYYVDIADKTTLRHIRTMILEKCRNTVAKGPFIQIYHDQKYVWTFDESPGPYGNRISCVKLDEGISR